MKTHISHIKKYQKENQAMKKITFILTFTILLFSACTTTYQVRSMYDDVYYSRKNATTQIAPREKEVKTNELPTVAETETTEYVNSNENVNTVDNTSESVNNESTERVNYSNSETYYDEEGNPVNVTNNYFYDYDDYYDYAYSSRIKRFHRHNGFNYYNDFYTNYYWYTSNPWDWGVSIYMGSPWWYPSYYYYNPPYYWSDYYPHMGMYSYNYWGSPWYWNSYHHGYHNGYWDGYWNGYWDGHYANYYYNSYDNNSNYYGPKKDLFSSKNVSPSTSMSFGEKYEKTIAQKTIAKQTTLPNNLGKDKANVSTSKISMEKTATDNKTNTSGKTFINTSETTKVISGKTVVAKPEADKPMPTVKATTTIEKGNNSTNVVTPKEKVNVSGTTKQVESKKYTVPTTKTTTTPPQGATKTYDKPKTYVSPSYTQPKSNQYYSKPGSTVTPSNKTTIKTNESYSVPKSTNTEKSSTPVYTPKSNNSYSTPKSNNSYTPKSYNSTPSSSPSSRPSSTSTKESSGRK